MHMQLKMDHDTKTSPVNGGPKTAAVGSEQTPDIPGVETGAGRAHDSETYGGSGEGENVSSEARLTEARSAAEDTAPSSRSGAGTAEVAGPTVGHDRVPGRRGNGHLEPIGTRPLSDTNGFLAKRSRADRGGLLDAQPVAGVGSNDTGDATPASATSEGNDSVFGEKVPAGSATERGASSPRNGTPDVGACPKELVPENEFGPVDVDYFAHLIPKTSDPEGDCILRKRLEQQVTFIAVVDARGKLVSPARDFRIRQMTGLPILLRVKHFSSEAEAKEFVYECHDGGLHFAPADLRKMRHDRVRNLFSMNMKVPEIARRTGLDESTIRKIHKRNFPDMKREDGRALPAEKAARVKEMIAQNCPPAQISAEAGVSKSTVSRLSKPGPKKKPEQIPEASEENVVEEVHRRATDSGDPAITAPAEEKLLIDAMSTGVGNDDLLSVDEFTQRALGQTEISVEEYLQELQKEVEERAVDAVDELMSDLPRKYRIGTLVFERAFYRLAMARLDREILKHLDERSKPDEKVADLKPGPKKKNEFWFGSPFDGISASQVAWTPLGWKCAWTSEIDPFAIRVVKHHFGTENLGDINKISDETLRERPIDLLVGGSPCESFSSLGKRQGMDDPRGELALRFLEVAGVAEPRWIVFENVPCIKGSKRGRDFGTFLGTLEKLGYGWAYRTFNARYFGLAQSRERVFVVGYRGDWRRAAAVLFERASFFGASSARGESRQDTPGTAGVYPAGGLATTGARPRRCIGFHKNAQGCQIASTTRDLWLAATLTASQRAAVAYEVPGHLVFGIDGFNQSIHEEVYHTLRAGRDSGDAVAIRTTVDGETWWVVRHLMPVECEALQGFPAGYTQVPDHRGKPAADTPRYESLGRAFPPPIMRWIGERIQIVEAMDIPEKG